MMETEGVTPSTTEATQTQQHQHEEFYPTPGIMKMIEDFKELVPLREDDKQYELLNEKLSMQYRAVTKFDTIVVVQSMVAFFKIHIAYALAEGFKKHAPDFVRLAEEINTMLPPEYKKLTERDHQAMAEFYEFMLRRKIENRNVFIAYTRDLAQHDMFDLLESVDKRRRITCDECNHCHKRDVPLHKCTVCLRAAYCCKECQRGDWTFHKQFCKHLNKGTEA
jgi:rubrerythrin